MADNRPINDEIELNDASNPAKTKKAQADVIILGSLSLKDAEGAAFDLRYFLLVGYLELRVGGFPRYLNSCLSIFSHHHELTACAPNSGEGDDVGLSFGFVGIKELTEYGY